MSMDSMTAQEWLENARKIIADCDRSKLSFQIVCNAAAIIRSQQERIEMLTAKLAELKAAEDLCNSAKTLSDCNLAAVKWQALYDALFVEAEGK